MAVETIKPIIDPNTGLMADWDKFLKVLNWYQQEDTYE